MTRSVHWRYIDHVAWDDNKLVATDMTVEQDDCLQELRNDESVNWDENQVELPPTCKLCALGLSDT